MASEIELTAPVSLEAEIAILGAVLLNNECLTRIAGSIRKDDFSSEAHRTIYGRILELAEAGTPIDFATLADRLNQYRELQRVGGNEYVMALTDGLPRHQNIQHYAAILRSKALLRRTVKDLEAVQQWACSPGADAAAVVDRLDGIVAKALSESSAKRIDRLEDIPDVLSIESSPVRFVVQDLIPRGALVLLTGLPGIGKSSLALRLCIACAAGEDFLGRRCAEITCLYLDKENPLSLVQQRLATYGGDGAVGGLHVWGGWLADEPPQVRDGRLLRIAADVGPLIVFDSLVRFHGADENDASQMRDVMAYLRRLADSGATVLVLHHCAKSDGSKYRGSSDILAAVDVAYSLEKRSGTLQLHRFKSRFSTEAVLKIRADFAKGEFHLFGATPAVGDERDAVAEILAIIRANPGAKTRDICKAAERKKISRQRTLDLLERELDKSWRWEPGPHRARRYYPVPSVPSVPPHKAAERRNTVHSAPFSGRGGTPEHEENKGGESASAQ